MGNKEYWRLVTEEEDRADRAYDTYMSINGCARLTGKRYHELSSAAHRYTDTKRYYAHIKAMYAGFKLK